MVNTSLKSLKARYPDLFPLDCSKDDFIKYLEFFKTVNDRSLIVNSKNLNYKPYMVAYLLKYLTYTDKYPSIMVLNAHEISEIYITGSQDGSLLRLSDINADILFLTAGYSEPSNKSLKDCIGYLMNSYALNNKNMFIYLKDTSTLVRDIEGFAKTLEIPSYSLSNINIPKKVSKSSNKPSNGSQMSLF